jgi:hypothetical protein
MKITIAKLPSPEHSGDWHDKPLKWQVSGPGSELQKFTTQKEAKRYAKIRRHSRDFNEASSIFVLTD